MFKRILRSKPVLRGVGKAIGAYLKLVKHTTRFVTEPADAEQSIYGRTPIIVAMWHGQHLMIAFVKRPQDKTAVIISRHGDGEINAAAVEAFGFVTLRGSGAQRQDQVRKRGGSQALRLGLKILSGGTTLGLTADVPKISRVAGRGIIVTAQMSGRPIVPIAVVTARRIDFNNWDRTSIGLPFGKGAIVFGTPIEVPRTLTLEATEQARIAVQEALDAVHARAYALIGQQDPGAGRDSVREARAKAAADHRSATVEDLG